MKNSATIAVRELKPGDQIIFDDGAVQLVREAKFGHGLIVYLGRTARVVFIEFEDGNKMPAHPAELVRVARNQPLH